MVEASMAVLIVVSVIIAFLGFYLYRGRSDAALDSPRSREQLDQTELHERMLAKHTQIRRLSTALGQRDHITVADLMTTQLTVVNQRAAISDVRSLMKGHRTRHLLVQDKNDLLIGIISDRDLTRRERGVAADIMTADPSTVAPECPISEAVRLVLGRRVSCLPVVDQGRLCGVLTSTDLLVILECLLQEYENSARSRRPTEQQDPEPQAAVSR